MSLVKDFLPDHDWLIKKTLQHFSVRYHFQLIITKTPHAPKFRQTSPYFCGQMSPYLKKTTGVSAKFIDPAY
jgi:hypothetical protein